MKRCEKCGLNFLDHLDSCTECGAALGNRIDPPAGGFRFQARLQHLPADILSQYRGGLIISGLDDALTKADRVLLSTLACDERSVIVHLEVV